MRAFQCRPATLEHRPGNRDEASAPIMYLPATSQSRLKSHIPSSYRGIVIRCILLTLVPLMKLIFQTALYPLISLDSKLQGWKKTINPSSYFSIMQHNYFSLHDPNMALPQPHKIVMTCNLVALQAAFQFHCILCLQMVSLRQPILSCQGAHRLV